MKTLVASLVILLTVGILFAQPTREITVIVGELVDNQATRNIYDETGCAIVIPFEGLEGIKVLGDNGHICAAYGGCTFEGGICKFCGKENKF